MRRRTTLLAALMVLLGVSPAYAHTALVKSNPTAKSVVAAGAIPMRLEFSEPIEASLCTIRIVTASGDTVAVKVRPDPRDVHAMLADYTPSAGGEYRVLWHVVSADGHPVNGSYGFTVTAPAAAPPMDTMSAVTPNTPALVDTTAAAGAADTGTGAADPMGVPLTQAILRALSAFFIIASAGVLVFIGWLMPAPGMRMRVRTAWLAIAAALASSAHALTWAMYATGDTRLAGAWAALTSGAGRAELARAVLAILTVWALLLVRRTRVSAAFAVLTLLATAFIGHAASFSPALLIPLKAIHLGAAAMWLGGLMMLFSMVEMDTAEEQQQMRTMTLRVSAIALTSVILLGISGVLQTVIVTGLNSAAFTSRYGLLSLAKVGVLMVLVAMGAMNKFKHLPAYLRGEAFESLRKLIRLEIALIAIAIAIAGVLAYTSPPARPDAAADGNVVSHISRSSR